MKINDLRQTVDGMMTKYTQAVQQVRHEKAQRQRAEKSLHAHRQALALLQKVAQEVQQQAHARIAGVVTQCLGTVFNDPYTFTIPFEKKRNKTEAVLRFVRAGQEMNPRTSSMVSAVQVAAFGLRLAGVVLSLPARRRLLVLDEPFLALDRENIGQVGRLLTTLAAQLNMQIIMVTHSSKLMVGKVVEV
jgi:DNA repair exonuclease SbcCD ATPase subunit